MDWYLIAFISAFLSATAAIFQKKVLFNIDALELSLILSFFDLLLISVFFYNISLENVNIFGIIILYAKTILGVFSFWCVMLAIKNMEISGALPMMVLTPGLVAIFSFIFLKEQISHIEILGLSLLLLGTYILELKRNESLWNPFTVFIKSKYHHYIVYALILMTISSIIDKMLVRDFKLEPFTFIAFQQVFLAINFVIIFLVLRGNPIKLLPKLNLNLVYLIIFISVLTVGYRYTQIEAIKIAPVALVLSVKRTSVFFASIIGGKIFLEHNLLKKAIAVIIMLVGAYLLT